MKFEGVYVATVTPFTSADEVCLTTLEHHLRWLASKGVQGFVPLGTTGEASVLDWGERTEILKLTEFVGRSLGLQLIAGCGSNNTQVALQYIQEAETLGYDACLVVTPYYNKPTAAGLIAHYRFLADNSSLPIILYNVPGRTAVNMTPETVATLLEHPRIIGIKEASGNHAQWQALSASIDWSNRSFLSGDDDAFATMLAMGATGMISASANLYPEGFVAIHEMAKKNDFVGAFQLQKKLMPLINAMFLETSPAPVKYALHALGLGTPGLRLPLVPVGATTEVEIRKVLIGLELASAAPKA